MKILKWRFCTHLFQKNKNLEYFFFSPHPTEFNINTVLTNQNENIERRHTPPQLVGCFAPLFVYYTSNVYVYVYIGDIILKRIIYTIIYESSVACQPPRQNYTLLGVERVVELRRTTTYKNKKSVISSSSSSMFSFSLWYCVYVKLKS